MDRLGTSGLKEQMLDAPSLIKLFRKLMALAPGSLEKAKTTHVPLY